MKTRRGESRRAPLPVELLPVELTGGRSLGPTAFPVGAGLAGGSASGHPRGVRAAAAIRTAACGGVGVRAAVGLIPGAAAVLASPGTPKKLTTTRCGRGTS